MGFTNFVLCATMECYQLLASTNTLYWGEPEQAPHWLKSVMVSYVACTDCENDKIRLTSHSSFVMVSYVACTDCENDKIRLTSHSSFVMVRTSCVRTVRTIKYDGQTIQRFIRRVCRL